jgi:hypothetical protein
MKSLVLTAALCAITSFIAAQKLVGIWVNDDFALQYEFYQNGNYSLTSKDYGNFSGTYNYFKQTISLFDFQGNLTVQYFVQQHTANRLSLVDGNNFAFVLQRKEQVTTSVGMEAFSAARYPRVLAEKGNQKILEADARLYTAAISFLVQDQLNESHYQEIEKALIADFNKNPKAAMNDLAGLRQGMEYIFTLHDPMEIGIVRQRILGAVYYGSVVQHQPNAYWNITDRFIDVIAYDPTNFLVLTTEDLNDSTTWHSATSSTDRNWENRKKPHWGKGLPVNSVPIALKTNNCWPMPDCCTISPGLNTKACRPDNSNNGNHPCRNRPETWTTTGIAKTLTPMSFNSCRR